MLLSGPRAASGPGAAVTVGPSFEAHCPRPGRARGSGSLYRYSDARPPPVSSCRPPGLAVSHRGWARLSVIGSSHAASREFIRTLPLSCTASLLRVLAAVQALSESPPGWSARLFTIRVGRSGSELRAAYHVEQSEGGGNAACSFLTITRGGRHDVAEDVTTPPPPHHQLVPLT